MAETVSAKTGAELPSTPEKFKEQPALQARLLMGAAALNPDKKDLPAVTAELLGKLEERDYSPFNIASTKSRANYWYQETQTGRASGDFDSQYRQWSADTLAVFSSSKNASCIEKLRNLNQQSGIRFDQMNDGEVKKLYDRYCANTDLPTVQVTLPNGTKQYISSDVKKFVTDIVNAYKVEGKIQYEKLQADLPSFQWLANILGRDIAPIIAQLIDAEAKLQGELQRQQLINEANQIINQPTAQEQEMLNPIWQAQKEKPATPPVRRPTPQPQPEPPQPEIKPQDQDPWSKVPKPDQPIKIREGKIERDPQTGKIKHEEAEQTLILGTSEHPLVVEAVWSDGREKVRIRDAERPYHIPAIIYFDQDVTPQQRALIEETLPSVFEELGVPSDFVIPSDRSAAEFFNKLHPSSKRKNQFHGGSVLTVAKRDQSQTEKPHHAVIFTNKDLYMEDANFVVGVAVADIGTVISLDRVWRGIKDPTLRNNVIKTEIAHEIGHIFDLPSKRRGETNLDYETVPGGGGHCKSPGCCMKQGNAVPADFIRITQERLKKLPNRFFCDECVQDLQEKFTAITPPEIQPNIVTGLKSMAEIIDYVKTSAETGMVPDCILQFDKDSLGPIIDELIKNIEIKRGPLEATIQVTQPTAISINNQEGRMVMSLVIEAGILGQTPVVVDLALDKNLNLRSMIAQPPRIKGQDITQIIQQKSLAQRLQEYLQSQLEDVNLENVDLQFTPEDQLQMSIKTRRIEK